MSISAFPSHERDRGIGPLDRVTAGWMAAILLVTQTIWISFQDGALKYVIYSLPFTLTLAYLVINEWRLRLHKPGFVALCLYMACALTSAVANAWFDFLAVRDLAIVGGYLMLFVLWFRAPSWTADLCLAALFIGMLVEAATAGGVGEAVNWFGSDGILESTLAFPLGVVLLYYLHTGKWGRALLTLVLFFLAFKRIAFLGVAAAVAYDLVVGRYFGRSVTRSLALALVVALSIVSLFSAQLFELVSSNLNLERTNANSISLGRYDIAVRLWQEWDAGALKNWLIGFGPGSADATVMSMAKQTLINPHNDWLKILFDYGVIGFVVLHAVIFMTLTENRLGVMLYIYAALVMMTDNILIYMFYHPFVLLMICTSRR